jgi:diguanylate cyclase (GGDEF)-like protein
VTTPAGGRRIAVRRRPLLLIGAPSLVIAVAAFLAAPKGAGGIAFVGVVVLGLVGLVVGPSLRRAEPRGPWRLMALAGLFFLVGLALRIGVLPRGRGLLESPDLWVIVGYLTTLWALLRMLSSTAKGSGRLAALDAMIVTSGASLGFFSAEVGPHLGLDAHRYDLYALAINMLYPVLDAALLSITVHLAFRTSRRSPALGMLLGAFTTWLVADMTYVVLWHFRPGTTSPYIEALFMVSFALAGAAATHPSVTELARPATATQAPARSGRSVVLLTLLVPAGAAVMMPTSGRLDATVRVALLSLVLLAVFLRMMYTVKALRKAEEDALHQALHDPLTGLANRAAFLVALRERIASPEGAAEGVSVVCLDADRFKLVNDTWGHPVGDELILMLARRLRGKVQAGDELFRLGGDEFVVIARGGTPAVARTVAERLLTIAEEPLVLSGGQRIVMTASIGVAQAAAWADADADALVRDADIALYTAKDSGRATWVQFDQSLRSSIEHRVRLADELRAAVTAGEVRPHYQAIMTGPGYGSVAGFEALARWTHPEDGPVSPAEFIPVAEDTGLIVEIGDLMLRQACHQLMTWRRATGRDLHVSVNLSATQIARSDVPRLVREALGESELPAHALWIEITESLLMTNRTAAAAVLEQLAGLGVVLCIDDFGTGYSSLSYLKDFPVQVVKVDRSFVRQLTTDAKSRGVTRAIIEMVNALELTGVVAEGVELPEQAEALEGMGCTWGQGFLWARPMAPDAVAEQVLGLPAPVARPAATRAPA